MTTSPSRRVRNTLAMGAARVVVMGGGFLLWVHIARTLAPEAYSVLTFGQAVLAYFLLAIGLGFDPIAVREIARDPGRSDEMTSNVLGIRLALFAAASALYAVYVGVAPVPEAERSALYVLGLLLLVRATQVNWLFEAHERMTLPAVRDVGATVASVAAAYVLVRDSGDAAWAALSVTLPPLVANATLFAAALRRWGAILPRYDRTAWRTLFATSLPLAASTFFSEVYYSLDKVMLGYLRPPAELGEYGAAYRVLGLGLAPALLIAQVFFPSLSMSLGDRERMASTGGLHLRLQSLLALPFLAALPFAAPDIVAVVYGAEYAGAAPALAVLLINAGVVALSMGVGIACLAWNADRRYLWIVSVGAALNVVLNLLVIERYGTLGAAITTALSEGAILALLVWTYRQYTGDTLGRYFARWTVVAVGMAATAAWVQSASGSGAFAAAAGLGAGLLLSVPTKILDAGLVRDLRGWSRAAT